MPRVVELRVHDAPLIVYICESHGHTDNHYEYMLTILYAATRAINIVICTGCTKSGCVGSESGTVVLKININNWTDDWSSDWGHYICREDINC
jgi:hypothetical protein